MYARSAVNPSGATSSTTAYGTRTEAPPEGMSADSPTCVPASSLPLEDRGALTH